MVVKSDGSIWFTDPPYGILSDYEGHKAEPENGFNVYRVDGQSGAISGRRPTTSSARTGSPSRPTRSKLYIVDSAGGRVKGAAEATSACSTSATDGKLSGGKEFADCTAGRFDGMRFDTEGRAVGRDR